MDRRVSVKAVPHLSLQTDRAVALDEIDAQLLRRISETGSLVKAAKGLGISYRNAWGRVKRVELMLGTKLLESKSGGAVGGGSRLTPEGAALFKEFRRTRKYLFNVLDEQENAGNVRYTLSARNLVGARITRVERGDVTSLVRMSAEDPVSLTSIISNEAVDDLGLEEGDRVAAVIKSTEVMIAKRIQGRRGRGGRRGQPAEGTKGPAPKA